MKMFDFSTDPRSFGQRLLVVTLISLFAYWYVFIHDQNIMPALKALSIALFGDDLATYVRALPRLAIVLMFVGIAALLLWLRPSKPEPGSGLPAWFDYLACWIIPIVIAMNVDWVVQLYGWPLPDMVLTVSRHFTSMIALPLDASHARLTCGSAGEFESNEISFPVHYMLTNCPASYNVMAVLPYAALYALWRRVRSRALPRQTITGGDLTGTLPISHDDGGDTRMLPRR